jgi:hypothetical protein
MIMESTNEKTLFEVAEIQLTYKSRVKASLRPKIQFSRSTGMKTKLGLSSNSKFYSSIEPTRLSVFMKFHQARQRAQLLIRNPFSSQL